MIKRRMKSKPYVGMEVTVLFHRDIPSAKVAEVSLAVGTDHMVAAELFDRRYRCISSVGERYATREVVHSRVLHPGRLLIIASLMISSMPRSC